LIAGGFDVEDIPIDASGARVGISASLARHGAGDTLGKLSVGIGALWTIRYARL
jgi:hypothetical protein